MPKLLRNRHLLKLPETRLWSAFLKVAKGNQSLTDNEKNLMAFSTEFGSRILLEGKSHSMRANDYSLQYIESLKHEILQKTKGKGTLRIKLDIHHAQTWCGRVKLRNETLTFSLDALPKLSEAEGGLKCVNPRPELLAAEVDEEKDYLAKDVGVQKPAKKLMKITHKPLWVTKTRIPAVLSGES